MRRCKDKHPKLPLVLSRRAVPDLPIKVHTLEQRVLGCGDPDPELPSLQNSNDLHGVQRRLLAELGRHKLLDSSELADLYRLQLNPVPKAAPMGTSQI